ncbi:MAG: pyridoxal phosphate-dependent aminotransferase [Candidatus Omnitrophota bacterium]
MFANRTHWPSKTNKIISRLEDLKKERKKIIDLTESNPTVCGFHYPQEILSPLGDPKNIIYEPCPLGLLESREAVGRYYQEKGYSVSPQRIALTSSTSEGYAFILRLLCNEKENVLVPKPSYPLFDLLAQLNDVELKTYTLPGPSWRIDPDDIEKAINRKTRAIILVNPNNPTGSFVGDQDLKKINEICKKYNLAIISDEVFLDYAFDDQDVKATSCVHNSEVLTFTLSGVSKILGLPQMKISWIVTSGPDSQVKESQRRLEIILDTYLSVNTPSQRALISWMPLRRDIQKEICDRLRKNHDYLRKALSGQNACDLLDAQGGWYALLRLPQKRKEEEWVLEFLEHDLVFVHPGYFFDFEQEPVIVLSLLPAPELFQEGLDRLVRKIKQPIS